MCHSTMYKPSRNSATRTKRFLNETPRAVLKGHIQDGYTCLTDMHRDLHCQRGLTNADSRVLEATRFLAKSSDFYVFQELGFQHTGAIVSIWQYGDQCSAEW
jgi:hypothetical protein